MPKLLADNNHIVHIVYSLKIGGLERVLVNCINGLPRDLKHSIICLTEHSKEFASLLPANVNIIDLHKSDGKGLGLHKRVYKLIQQHSPDVVHTYNLAAFEMQFVAWLNRVPIRIHAEHGRDIYDPTGANVKYRILRKVLSFFTHHIVSVSSELHDWLKNDIKISQKKLTLIRNGICTETFKPSQKQSEEFVFGHVGRLSPIKNQGLLLQAFNYARNKDSGFKGSARLKIVGDGECMQSLTHSREHLGLEGSVQFTGAKMDILAQYHSFDAFVMSSLAEGIPMTLLEAMSCGLPAIITTVGGMTEVVNDTVGYSVDSESVEQLGGAMLSMFNNKKTTQTMGEHARARVIEQFSQTNMINAYANLYQGHQ